MEAQAHQDPRKETAADLWKRMELGLVPDDEIRIRMRIGLEKRLNWGYKSTHQQQLAQLLNFAKCLRSMKMAAEIETLDFQMYETPTAMQQIMCGSTIKESSGLFKDESTALDDAQIAMMDLYCEKARIEDGQRILDLGCGHGALILHVAQKYNNCHVTGVTNSLSQKDFIANRCKELDLSNAEVILADVTTVELDISYDRVFIIGLIEPVDEDDWYNMFIFPPGTLILPSASFLLYFQDDVTVIDHWTLSGNHFARTQQEWLKRLDARIDEVREMFVSACGGKKEEAVKLLKL